MKNKTNLKTRFAPSPTGYLHIGGVRTALFSWLYARKLGGQFVLRIEDTDRERSTQESVQAILDGMQWLGLDYSEGPYYQTKRFDRYNDMIQQLLDTGHAYYCHCSKERLDAIRNEQMKNKQKPRYDGHCRDKGLDGTVLNQGETFAVHGQSNLAESERVANSAVVRFKNPLFGEVIFDDIVRGQVSISNEELDDLIIRRSDGTPTYNFSVVIDDHDMGISHVIRGDDHINNTPRQINIFQALGAEIPCYGHVPMILGLDGKRLSKRHGAVSVIQYQKEGYLPEALLNYLVRLGWSYGDQEIFSLTEMIELFDINNVNKAAATFDPDKLLWFNQHYMKTLDVELLAERAKVFFEQQNLDLATGPKLRDLIEVQRERCKTLIELVNNSIYFYRDIEAYDEKAAKKNLNPDTKQTLQALREAFSSLQSWELEALHEVVKNTASQLDLKMGKVAQPLRVALTGNTVSPSIDKTLLLLGRECSLQRLGKAIDYIN